MDEIKKNRTELPAPSRFRTAADIFHHELRERVKFYVPALEEAGRGLVAGTRSIYHVDLPGPVLEALLDRLDELSHESTKYREQWPDPDEYRAALERELTDLEEPS